MIILGLTGSIGMGKTATASMFKDANVPVYDADAAVHALYEPGGAAVDPLAERFDGVLKDGGIDRLALRKHVINDPQAMADLEAIVHPFVGVTQLEFRNAARETGSALAVLDIPLLFETGGNTRCDYVAMVTAPAEIQRQRVLDRPGMTPEAFEAILAKQTPDAEKRAQSDFIISTAFGFDFTRAHVMAIIDVLGRLDIRETDD